MKVSPKVILITGASTGFGRDTAETLARAGHAVYASMRDLEGRNRPHAEALRRLATADHLNLTAIELDVTSTLSVDRAIQTILAEPGNQIDVIVNNAGIASAGVSESFTPEQVRDLFEVNVFGVQRVLRATLPALRAQGDGLVVNIGSILGRVTFPFFGLYGASKYAIEALTDSYRYELRPLGVDVVLVQPSAYPTNMYASAQQPANAERGAEYGETGAIPGKMFQTFMEIFASESAPKPHDVAEAIARLVTTAKGQRPDRVVVGQSFGADAVNSAVAPVQRQVVEGLGLGALASAFVVQTP